MVRPRRLLFKPRTRRRRPLLRSFVSHSGRAPYQSGLVCILPVCLYHSLLLYVHVVNEGPNTHRLFNPNPPTSKGVIVDPTPSSSQISAPPTDSRIPKLSFQTFTKFIPSPFSWSSRSTPVAENSPQTSLPIREGESRVSLSRSSTDSADRTFVSKERQLEKLRSRMEEEVRMRVRARA